MKMKGFFRKLVRRTRARTFYAWQIELTTRCTLQCAMCMRSGRDDWLSADMSLDDFKKLIPYFSDVETVVLEGWGEPLLYPDLLEFVRLVKDAGAQAGFVTSGKGLDEAYSRALLDREVDFMGFSFAGATAATHNRIRIGSDLDEVVEGITFLRRIREERGLQKPRLHLVYLMMKDNIRELPAFMSLAATMGIGEIALLNQIAIVNDRQEGQRVYNVPESGQYERVLKETAIKAAELGIRIRRPSLFPSEVAVCDENPLRNLYISVTGDVSPCVYLNPPLTDPASLAHGCPAGLNRTSFGNILLQPLADIWKSEEYLQFRHCFAARKCTLDDIHARLGGMGIDFPSADDPLSEAPGPCSKCYKLFGA